MTQPPLEYTAWITSARGRFPAKASTPLRSANAQSAPLAALTIATIPARIASGGPGQAAKASARSTRPCLLSNEIELCLEFWLRGLQSIIVKMDHWIAQHCAGSPVILAPAGGGSSGTGFSQGISGNRDPRQGNTDTRPDAAASALFAIGAAQPPAPQPAAEPSSPYDASPFAAERGSASLSLASAQPLATATL